MANSSPASAYRGNLLFYVDVERRGEVWWIAARGELDLSTAPMLEREILACEAGDDRPIVIDLSALAFMDVAGLRVLLAASGRSRTGTNRLSLVRGSSAVKRVVELTGSEALLPFTDRPGLSVVSQSPEGRNDSRRRIATAPVSNQAGALPAVGNERATGAADARAM